MKLCFIADARSIHAQRWTRFFAQRGHEVHLISPMPAKECDIGASKLYVLKSFPHHIKFISGIFNLLYYFLQLKKIIRQVKPRILHAHYVTDCGLWGALCGHHPFILSAWGSDILVEPTMSRVARYFTRFALKRAELILAAGDRLVEPIIKLGATPDKISLLPIGVDIHKFAPVAKHKNTAAVISTRTLAPIYNVETLIRAIPLVLKQIPEAKFTIAGDGAQKSYLEDLAKSLDVTDSVSFVGHLPHDHLPGYLASADVYVSTSLSDGSSISMLEAMACGPAPIVTDVGDVRNWITDGKNGFIIPPQKPDLLADSIMLLLKNQELRAEMGQINRRLIEERADFQKNMIEMERLYEQLVKEPKES